MAIPPRGPAFYGAINEVLQEVHQESNLIALAASIRSGPTKPFLLQVQSYLDRSSDTAKHRLYNEAWKEANPRWRNRPKRSKNSDGTTR